MGQVVEDLQAHGVLALGLFPALDLVPGLIQRAMLAILVDDIEQRTADALQDVGVVVPQSAAVDALGLDGAAFQRALEGGLGVSDAEGHAVGRRAVVLGEVRRLALGRAVDQHGDVALLQAHRVGGRVHMGGGEAHQLQPGDHGLGLGTGEFNEFETVHAQRVFLVEFGGGVLHDASPLIVFCGGCCRRLGRNLMGGPGRAQGGAASKQDTLRCRRRLSADARALPAC
ncbi:hypothetical protein D3C72_1489550 [compost metagenome]